MTQTDPRHRPTAGPVRLTEESATVLRPATSAAITGGLWAERRRVNREVSIPGAWDRLHEAGNFTDLELAAGRAEGRYDRDLPFMDSDLYKWLEAVGWVLADPELTPDSAARLSDQLAQTAELLRAAQQPDGYLDSHFQLTAPGERFVQLRWGHELYCAGHLIQAAVALRRTTGSEDLLQIARRVADLITDSFGTEPERIDGVCGHPEIETALVELYRETGDRRYLDRAGYFVDRRGHGLLGNDRFGLRYYQDHEPVRAATSVEGHAVRQLYLLAGVADVQAETADPTLLAASRRLWAEMAATKTYLTGGIGAHHQDEAFGDAYELPSERSYCETCAAIASVMFCWRMLISTGDARYADLLERTLYNGFLAGLSLDGQRYIYANPLQVRDDHQSTGNDGDYTRVPWFHCACCPPNVMRLLASLEHYVVLAADDRVVLHQYVPGEYAVELAGGRVELEVETDYPWDGTVSVRVVSGPAGSWELALRVPDWAQDASLAVGGEAVTDGGPVDGWWSVAREWAEGDVITLTLPLVPRFTRSDPRVDATRGAVALERGPLVYCFESADQPDQRLDDLVLDPSSAVQAVPAAAELGPVVALRVAGQVRRDRPATWWPYRSAEQDLPAPEESVQLTAVPYYTWGNRGPGAMRTWVPTS